MFTTFHSSVTTPKCEGPAQLVFRSMPLSTDTRSVDLSIFQPNLVYHNLIIKAYCSVLVGNQACRSLNVCTTESVIVLATVANICNQCTKTMRKKL